VKRPTDYPRWAPRFARKEGPSAAARTRPKYPRLGAAWRALAGAAALAPAIAGADVTPPPQRRGGDPPRVEPPRPKGEMPAPQPPQRPAPMPQQIDIEPGGVMVMPEPPKPPKVTKDPKSGKIKIEPQSCPGKKCPVDGTTAARTFRVTDALADAGLVLHPHGPDEPCRRRG
jgi:hypothetical protein